MKRHLGRERQLVQLHLDLPNRWRNLQINI
jgi:hypothetical protein